MMMVRKDGEKEGKSHEMTVEPVMLMLPLVLRVDDPGVLYGRSCAM